MEVSYQLNTQFSLRLGKELPTACCTELESCGEQKFTAPARNGTSIPRSLTRYVPKSDL
jgi:hypothetical protein